MSDAPEYSYSSASEQLFCTAPNKRKKKISKNQRRFSDDQIRSLEVTFESDTKLEPRKKAQLAKELGLEPRQVAIWFQNRRARWKSKQIEKDYSLLLADYNNLASQLDSLKRENQSLLVQLQKLKSEMVTSSEVENCHIQTQETAALNSSSDGESDYGIIDFEVKNVPNRGMELLGVDEESEMLRMVDPAVESSSEDWGCLDSDDLMNQTTESYQWLDFWG